MPDGVNVVDSIVEREEITPVSELHKTLLQDEDSPVITFDENRNTDAGNWTHDVLAKYPDANLTAEHRPARPEDLDGPVSGPRLAISDLNLQTTYDFGLISMDQVAVHNFTATNVGDEDLVIGRVYTGCGCTATRIGSQLLDAAGFLPTPMTLAPGTAVDFTIQYDPRAGARPEPRRSTSRSTPTTPRARCSRRVTSLVTRPASGSWWSRSSRA